MTKMDIFCLYGLPAIMIAFAITGVVLSIYFAYKRQVNVVFAIIVSIILVLFTSFVMFSTMDTYKAFDQAENATLVYGDLGIYTDNDTGRFFQIGYDDEKEEYCRYYLDEETVQGMRDYKDGKIKKAEDVDIFIDENGEYVILDENFKKSDLITIN